MSNSMNWIDTTSLDMENDGIRAVVKETNKKLDEFNSKHFVCDEGDVYMIYTERKNEFGEFMLGHLSYKNFAQKYNANTIYVPSGKKNMPFVKKGIGSYWLSCPQKRQYDGIIFNPNYTGTKFYNRWKGFKVTPGDGEFPHIEKHLREVWCNGNEEHYTYVLKWFAHMVQYPHIKPGVALVIKGEKGTGKTTFISKLARKLLEEHYLLVNSGREIYGRFNAQHFAKLLVTFDEAVWSGDKKVEGRLKSLITDENFNIEYKGMDMVTKKNFARYILLTNERFSVPATYDERRFFAMRMSNKYRNDTAYFSELYAAMDNGEIENFFGFLKKYDFNKDDVFSPPASSALFEDVYANMDAFDKWLYNLIDDYAMKKNSAIWDGSPDCIKFGSFVKTKSLFNNFEYFKERNYLSSSINTQTMLTQKMTNGKDGSYDFKYKKHEHSNCIFLPSVEDAKRKFQKKFSCEVVWNSIAKYQILPEYEETIAMLEKHAVGSEHIRKLLIKEAHNQYKDKEFKKHMGKMFR